MKCIEEIMDLISSEMDYGVRCQNENLQFIFFANDWENMGNVIKKYGLKWAQRKYDWVIVYTQFSCECKEISMPFFEKMHNGLILYIENNSYIDSDMIKEIEKMGYKIDCFQTHQGIGRLIFKRR